MSHPSRESSGEGEFEWAEFSNWILAGILIFVLGAYAQRYLNPAGARELMGRAAPTLQLPSARGDETLRLSEYRDRVVVLDFWATWCKVCEQQMPKLKAAVDRPEFDGEVAVVLVNTQESGEDRQAKVRRYLENRKLDYPTALDDGTVMQRYGVQGLPTMVIVDRNGEVAHVGEGLHPTEEIVGQLRQILGS